ncbi:caspase family protein [Roseibium sp. SCP14]|uniref:caspase family protein n=1 Tax=Roseibium sp. SCP14 TaxID=3141375 RepID=UPI003335FBA3
MGSIAEIPTQRWRYRYLFWILASFILAGSSVQAAEDVRVALVIGNSQYSSVPSLTNPSHDAADIGAALTRLGFTVEERHNLDSRALNIALRDFSRKANAADMAIIYFAGHGIEIDQRNYLVPVDAILEHPSDVTFEATEMHKFLQAVEGAKTLRLLLLDACRDNPFLRRMADASTRSLSRGLSRIEPQAGVLVGYSAKSGTVAMDGTGRNSPYAEALLAHMETPGLEIGQLFRRVRDTVLNNTRGFQEPFTYGSLPAADIYLAAPPPTGPSTAEILRDFLAADSRNSEGSWQAFIGQYDGVASEDVIGRARDKLAALRRRDQSLSGSQMPSHTIAVEDSPLIRACDQLAADPDDPDRPREATGVELGQIDVSAAVTACTLATSGHVNSARSHYQLARALTAANFPDRARKALSRSIELEYAAAGFFLGKSMLTAPGGLKDAQEAVAILEEAVANGNMAAARFLGDFFTDNGARLVVRGKSPLEYYQIAAAGGDVTAQFKAGSKLISMSNISISQRRKGIAWLEASADGGHQHARLRLAKFYLSPRTAPELRNISRGIQLLHIAVDANDIEAALLLARRYRLGDGVRPDLELSIKLTKKAAMGGDPLAIVEVGYGHETGRGLERNPSLAASSYFEALAAGSALPYLRQADEWPVATTRALQHLLARSPKARYRGPIDGDVGPGTRAAMARLCACRDGWPVRFATLFQVAEAQNP